MATTTKTTTTRSASSSTSPDRYTEAIGRRKTAIARARLTPAASMTVTINKKDLNDYFPTEPLRITAMEPFLKVTLPTQYAITVMVNGSGIAGQAVAVRHAISRALTDIDHTLRTTLKKEGFLKRDPRAKERKKPGLVKARKRKQWSKR